jgi:CRISPR-associated endonuclease Csn1
LNKIKKVKIIHEKGKKFSVKSILKKETKFAKSATGTNLFFCVYENKVIGISYYTPSFEELIEIQKQEAHIKFKDKHNVPKFILDKNNNKYDLKFYLQPNDLVYLPSDEEKDNPNLVNLENLNKSQVQRIYKFTDGSGTTANFIPSNISKVIFNLKRTEQTKRKISFPIQNEFGVGSPQSKNQKSINGTMIKENCWKLKINRLGEIIRVIR